MSSGCIDSLTDLYNGSSIPVVIFSGDMEIIWHNSSFEEYFPGQNIRSQNISALTKTRLSEKLQASPAYSGRFQLTISSNSKLSSTIVLLIFPSEPSADYPETFVGYIDDITNERKKMLRKTYLGLLEASKLKDDDTGNHIKRVGAYARRLSEECFMRKMYTEIINPDFIENIHFLAPMHDVGKIGTPDEILTKRGPLDEAQWAIMKEHTINGALILSNYPDSMATEIARAHHERWDGTGYMFGLAGDDIPLAARITAIADVYDALRMKRSYKEAFSHVDSVNLMREESGSHFDPNLIDVFLSISDIFEGIFVSLSDENQNRSTPEVEELPLYDDADEIETLPELEEL